ncbi:MAG: type II toxin-antitoxin system VapC family toxin [Chloroflexota bacterium]|nr:type II toxin-antitoxin system VapC family toxin [Chloroflexota bacterium]
MVVVDDSRLCLDTDVLIAYLKGREPGASAVEIVAKEYACCVASITAYELLFGVARAKKEIGEQALLGIMTILALSGAAARRAANLHADLVSRNQDIGIKDVFIAAICLEHAIPILTANERHFSRVRGLRVITPSQLVSA